MRSRSGFILTLILLTIIYPLGAIAPPITNGSGFAKSMGLNETKTKSWWHFWWDGDDRV